VTGGLSVAIPCRADEPGLGATLDSLFTACQHPRLPRQFLREMVVCLNGLKRGKPCAPLAAVHDFAVRHGISVKEVWPEQEDKSAGSEPFSLISANQGSTNSSRLSFIVLLTEQRGKPPAWNTLWEWTTEEMALFCDADVRVAEDAVYYLHDKFQQESHLRLVAAREVPVLQHQGTLWSRMGALPYRFDFGNVGGRLYLIRKNAIAGAMPEDLLLEDAWLTVAVGKRYVAKDLRAQVFFLPPATWRDCFAERVRTEGGKLQIRRVHGDLLTEGPIAQYRWRQFLRDIAMHEYPLVACSLGLRLFARLWAWFALRRKDFYALYRPFSSTKSWTLTNR
jgi:hypothetical protein